MSFPLMVEAGVVLLVLLTGLLMSFVTFLIWRHGYIRGWRAARTTPPTCLQCGYNLSGLTQCRCPECGSEFPLDELWRTYILSRRSPRGDDGSARLMEPEPQTT